MDKSQQVNVIVKNSEKIANVDQKRPRKQRVKTINTIPIDNDFYDQLEGFGNNKFWPLLHMQENITQGRNIEQTSSNDKNTENPCPTGRVLPRDWGDAVNNVRSEVSPTRVHSTTADMCCSVNKSNLNGKESNGVVKSHKRLNMTTLHVDSQDGNKVSENPGLGHE